MGHLAVHGRHWKIIFFRRKVKKWKKVTITWVRKKVRKFYELSGKFPAQNTQSQIATIKSFSCSEFYRIFEDVIRSHHRHIMSPYYTRIFEEKYGLPRLDFSRRSSGGGRGVVKIDCLGGKRASEEKRARGRQLLSVEVGKEPKIHIRKSRSRGTHTVHNTFASTFSSSGSTISVITRVLYQLLKGGEKDPIEALTIYINVQEM